MKKDIVFSAIESPITCWYKEKPLSNASSFHAHNGYEIICFLGDNVNIYYEKDSIKLHPGDIVLIPPYVFHRGYQEKNLQYIRDIMNIREDYTIPGHETDFKNILQVFFSDDNEKILFLHPKAHVFARIHELMKKLSEIVFDPKAEFKQLLIDAYTSQILTTLYTMQQHRRLNFSSDNFQTMQVPSYIIQTFQYINLHLLEEIHLDTLAELSHINKYYLCRSFRSYTGISIGQYIIEKRLILATKKIQAGISPSDACFQSGFNNYPNFSRTFSKRIGLSPKAYQMSVLAK